MAGDGREHHTKRQHRDSHGRFRQTDPSSSTADMVKLGPPSSSTASKVKLSPPTSSTASKVKLSPLPSSMVDNVKLGPTASSGGGIFLASSSWRAKLVEVIDLISSDGDSDDVLPPPPSYRFEVGSDDEDNDDVLLPPPSSTECCKRKAPVTDCSNKNI
jgi:hypothetical protein